MATKAGHAAAAEALAAAKQVATLGAPPITHHAFRPRQVFEASANLPASYFLGHHRAALERMRRSLADVGLVIECRDFRLPLTSWNPLLERSLATTATSSSGAQGARRRIVVYTKHDLGPPPGSPEGDRVMNRLRAFHRARGGRGGEGVADDVVFLGGELGRGVRGGYPRDGGVGSLLEAIKRVAREDAASGSGSHLTGLRALVVGMPNAGKSTLLNRLRAAGMGAGAGKVAATGEQAGITRKFATPVRVVPPEGTEDEEDALADSHHRPYSSSRARSKDLRESRGAGGGVYVIDTPGVFVPYVPDPEAMLRLALAGCIKDGLVDPVTVADYLLFRINRDAATDPAAVYGEFCPPTNDVDVLLDAVALARGRLLRGGVPWREAGARWVVSAWRHGKFGRFVLDDLASDEAIDAAVKAAESPALSLNQAKRREKETRKARALKKMQTTGSAVA